MFKNFSQILLPMKVFFLKTSSVGERKTAAGGDFLLHQVSGLKELRSECFDCLVISWHLMLHSPHHILGNRAVGSGAAKGS